MSKSQTIGTNVLCSNCAYNLRGLQYDGLCPECGESIANSFKVATSNLAKLLDDDPVNMANRLKFQAVADKVGCSVDGLMFVIDSIRQATTWKAMDHHYDAKFVCMAVRLRAIRYFNNEEEARELLAEWGLTSGVEIGKIVYGMVEAGLMRKREGDSIEQFSPELFDLGRLFPEG
jgi:uncharacterized repeat protein (TIGR04138 family)